MIDTYIDIVTDLPIDKVKQKLSDVTLQGNARQTAYQQKYIGEIRVVMQRLRTSIHPEIVLTIWYII